jgi:hypothetical protein
MLPIGNATLQVRFYRLLVIKVPTAKIAFRRPCLRNHCISSFLNFGGFSLPPIPMQGLSNE